MRLELSVNNKTKLSTSYNVDRSGKSSHLPGIKRMAQGRGNCKADLVSEYIKYNAMNYRSS